MSLHDAYARLTPYELVFPDPSAAKDLIARIDEESAGRGADPTDPQQFVTMGAVASYVGGLREPDAEPGAIQRYGALVYHAVHFIRAGCPLFLLTTHAARYLAEGAPEGDPEPPAPAGYLQLPQHLFWAESAGATAAEAAAGGVAAAGVATEATAAEAPAAGPDVTGKQAPESIDGIFWTATESGVLHTMLVTGVRPDRPGLGVIPLPEAPLADASAWLAADVRADGEDFSATLPGSELDRLLSFRAAGEALKLLARFFAYVGAVPSALERKEARSVDGGHAAPRASGLAYARVVLAG
jgi:hypothetical protein